jgi:hypothetical protein
MRTAKTNAFFTFPSLSQKASLVSLRYRLHELFLSLSFSHILIIPLFKGYYVFDECLDLVSPTLAVEVGVTYKFVQV